MAGQDIVQTALVKWMRTFVDNDKCETLDQLADGGFIASFLTNMDSEFFADQLKDLRQVNGDSRLRQHNLGLVLECITVYYQDTLQTIVLMELPILSAIIRDPASEPGLLALKKLLQLVLGCCVQCESRELYITRIKTMDSADQVEMMREIQEVMDELYPIAWDKLDSMTAPELAEQCRVAVEQLNKAAAERDNYAQRLDEISHERDFLLAHQEAPASPANRKATQSAERPSSSKRHFDSVRDLKTKIRGLTDELEQKSTMLEDALASEESRKLEITQLQTKVRQLQLAADETRQLKDDLDIWKAKAVENEKNKVELARFKERMEDFEYVTKRVEELKEQNKLLVEQMQKSKNTVTTTEELEQHVAAEESRNKTLQIQVDELTAAQRKQFEQLQTVNQEKLTSESEKSLLQQELEALRQDLEHMKTAQLEKKPSLAELQTEMERVPISDYTDLQDLLADAERRNAYHEKLHKDHELEVQQLMRTKTAMSVSEGKMKIQLENAMLKVKSVAAVNEELKKEIDQLRSSEGLAAKLGDALTKSISLKDERIRVLDDRLNDSLTQNGQLKEDIQIYKKHNDLLRASNRAAASPVMQRMQSRSSSRGDLAGSPLSQGSGGAAAAAETKAMQQQFQAAMKQQRAQSSQELRRASSQLTEAQKQIDDLAAENEALRETRQSESHQSDAASEELVRRTRQRADSLKIKVDSLTNNNDALQRMNETLTSELESTQEQLRSTEGAHTRTKDSASQLQKQLEISRQMKEGLEAENADLVAQLKKLLEQNQELLLKHMSAKDKLRDFGSGLSSTSSPRSSFASVSESGSSSETEGQEGSKPERKLRKGIGSRILKASKRLHLHRGRSGEDVPNRRLTPDAQRRASPLVNVRTGSVSAMVSPGSERMGVMEFILANKLEAEDFIKTPAKVPQPVAEDANPLVVSPPVAHPPAPPSEAPSDPSSEKGEAVTLLDFLLQEGRGPARPGSMRMPRRTSRNSASLTEMTLPAPRKKSATVVDGRLVLAGGTTTSSCTDESPSQARAAAPAPRSTAGHTPIKVKKKRSMQQLTTITDLPSTPTPDPSAPVGFENATPRANPQPSEDGAKDSVWYNYGVI